MEPQDLTEPQGKEDSSRYRVPKKGRIIQRYRFRIIRTGMLKRIFQMFAEGGVRTYQIDDGSLNMYYLKYDEWEKTAFQKRPRMEILLSKANTASRDFVIWIDGTKLEITSKYDTTENRALMMKIESYLKPLSSGILSAFWDDRWLSSLLMVVPSFTFTFVVLYGRNTITDSIYVALIICFVYLGVLHATNKIYKTEHDRNIFSTDQHKPSVILWIAGAVWSLIMILVGYFIPR